MAVMYMLEAPNQGLLNQALTLPDKMRACRSAGAKRKAKLRPRSAPDCSPRAGKRARRVP